MPHTVVKQNPSFYLVVPRVTSGNMSQLHKISRKGKVRFLKQISINLLFLLMYERISHYESSSIPKVKIFSSTLTKNTVLLWGIFIAVHYCLE